MTNYGIYRLSIPERAKYLFLALTAAGICAYIFYRDIRALFVMMPFVFVYPVYKKKDLIPKRRRKLAVEFKEAILILAAALSAGYSMENALDESRRELELLYGKDGMIVREFEYISHLVRMNIPIERALDGFAARSGLDDIRNFARVVRIAKRSGGDIVPVINHTANVINDKVRVQEEILTLTAAKRFEQSIMNIVPVLIVLYIDRSSPGFFTPMYTTLMGRMVMTACLAMYALAIHLSGKILDIKV